MVSHLALAFFYLCVQPSHIDKKMKFLVSAEYGPLPQCERGLGYEARITAYKSEDSVRKLLDPVEAEMAIVSWAFLDSIWVACAWM